MKLLYRIIEPVKKIPEERQYFNNKALNSMIIPLLIEQFLQLVVGIADSIVVSYTGQQAISGVTLVGAIYTVFIFLFTALGTGGAVIISQYLGRKDNDNSNRSAGQLYRLSMVFSLICMVLMLLAGSSVLRLLYPKVEPEVMHAANAYMKIVVLSFPANAIYNAGAAVYKSMGKTKVTMFISIAMNIINIAGDCIGVFVLKAGVAGVAWPTTISWYVAAVVITLLCMQKNESGVSIDVRGIIARDRKISHSILEVAIPNTIENGMFQVAKVVLVSVIATFGTAQIAANGIGQNIWNLSALIGIAIGPVYTNAVGRAAGMGDKEAAQYYLIKLTKYTIVLSIIWNTLLTATLPLILLVYSASEETLHYVVITTIIHNIFTATVSPIAQSVPYGFRAAGDIRYPMVAAIICTCFVRVGMTYYLGVFWGMGIVGYMWAMCIDWCVKALLMIVHGVIGNWKDKRLIA